MARKIYSAQGADLHPYTFDDATLLSIGTLIRACADLEDALTVFIAGVAVFADAGVMAVLMGKSPVSMKLKAAAVLVRRRKHDTCDEIFRNLFGEQFELVFRGRNALAHGNLLGQTADGHLAFETNELDELDPTRIETIILYSPHEISKLADHALKLVAVADKSLKLPALREKRRARPLLPHRKAHPKGRGRAKP